MKRLLVPLMLCCTFLLAAPVAAHPNGMTSKTAHAAELARIRQGLTDLIAKVDSGREELRRHRIDNGLENR